MKLIITCLLAIGLISCTSEKSIETAIVMANSTYFNTEEFTGLLTMGSDYSSARLDYQLDSQTGTPILFNSCEKVALTKESTVLTEQFALFRLLQINCKSLQQYYSAALPRKSYFPPSFSANFIRLLPAAAVPNIGGNSLQGRTGTLAEQETGLTFNTITPNSATVILDDDMEITYVLMARGDFDNDGVEDMLLRIDWSITSAFGSGFDLLMLSKTAENTPITVQWRY
jgi:hypothetical protein